MISRFKSLKNHKLNNKYLNILKAIEKKPLISVLPSKEKGKSLLINNSKNFLQRSSQPQLGISKIQKNIYFPLFYKISQQLLRKKYNCSKIVKNKLFLKFELRSIYDTYQISYLIKKIKSKIYCRLKEFSLLYNKKEYLINFHNQRESKKILKYLLFYVYDKIKVVYNEKATEKININKVKSNFEKIIPSLKNRNMLMMHNKMKKDEENKNNSNNNYKFIFDISPFDINNFTPNLYPNDMKILKVLKEYIKKNLYQKYFHKKYYYKNINGNYNINVINKSLRDSKNNKSKSKSKSIVNKSISKYIFQKNNNTLNNGKENKRIKNDFDIFDVEKLIKGFKIKYRQIRNKQFINYKKKNINKIKFSQKTKKKLFFNNSDINNKDTLNEKYSLSQKSITLSIKSKENEKPLKNGIIIKNKLTKHILQKNNVKINYKKIQNSYNNNLEKSISFDNRFNNNYSQRSIKYSYLRNNKFFNNRDENSESKILESLKYSMNKDTKSNNNNSKEKKFKLISLKSFLKFDDKTKYSSSNKPVKLLNTIKSFNFQNELPIFRKRRNENIWEKGEDISAQIKAVEVKEKVYKKIKEMNSKTVNNLKKCYTFRKMVDYGDIYYKDFSFN